MVTLWGRWRRVAHHAAVIQSNVLLFILYFLVIVPSAFMLRTARAMWLRKQPDAAPGWSPVPPAPH